MEALRQTNFNGGAGKMSPSPGNGEAPGSQGLSALLVMIAVLAILLAYCLWGAPWCRAFCRRTVCCFCPMDDPENFDAVSTTELASTPTIILLPFGRMLVVDSTVFAQLQADSTGIDFLELSANLIRAQRAQSRSISLLDSVMSEGTEASKGLTPTYSPPTYESIFGGLVGKDGQPVSEDLPPSYSELSLLFRSRNVDIQIVDNRARLEEEIQEALQLEEDLDEIVVVGSERRSLRTEPVLEEEPEGVCEDTGCGVEEGDTEEEVCYERELLEDETQC